MKATFFPNLTAGATDAPKDSILSRSLLSEERVKVTLFTLDAGQELTEHTAAWPAVLHFLQGEADLTLGAEALKATAGSWAYMPAHLPHSLVARTPLVMLLYLLTG